MLISLPFLKQVLVCTCLQYKSLENCMGKGEIACNESPLSTRINPLPDDKF